MIKWLFDWLRRKLGHYLLAEEEAEDKRRDEERARRMKDIIEADYTVDQTADDLEKGEF
jgi:hypothetical protein